MIISTYSVRNHMISGRFGRIKYRLCHHLVMYRLCKCYYKDYFRCKKYKKRIYRILHKIPCYSEFMKEYGANLPTTDFLFKMLMIAEDQLHHIIISMLMWNVDDEDFSKIEILIPLYSITYEKYVNWICTQLSRSGRITRYQLYRYLDTQIV